MAKQKLKSDLPTFDAEPVAGVEQVRGYEMAAEVMQSASTAAPVPDVTIKPVTVPLAQIPFGYLPRRIDLRKLTSRQSQGLRQLQEALDSQGMKLANGSKIGNPANAIKWLLESITN